HAPQPFGHGGTETQKALARLTGASVPSSAERRNRLDPPPPPVAPASHTPPALPREPTRLNLRSDRSFVEPVMMDVSGIWIPLVTPLAGGGVDHAALVRLVQHLAAQGVAGFVACG